MVHATCMNSSMQKLLQKRLWFKRFWNKNEITASISNFVCELKIHQHRGEEWIVPHTENASYESIISQQQSLTTYEWQCNELYLSKHEIKGMFSQIIPFVLTQLEKSMCDHFPQKTFCCIVSCQLGKYAHINVRVHMFRQEEFYLNRNLEMYTQPVLYRVISGKMAN